MKKYVVYYRMEVIEPSNRCNHHFEDFDRIEDAVKFIESLRIKETTLESMLMKLVTWKTEIIDITDEPILPIDK